LRHKRGTDTSRLLATAYGAVFLAAVAGCDSSPMSPSPVVLTGAWGGNHLSLTVMETSAHLEFDCAHGSIPGPLLADAQGSFLLPGTLVREHGGPIREDEMPDVHAATYAGAVTGGVMQLTVHLTATNEVIGTFNLTRGAAGRVVKCL
jgi:hypothetical protein